MGKKKNLMNDNKNYYLSIIIKREITIITHIMLQATLVVTLLIKTIITSKVS